MLLYATLFLLLWALASTVAIGVKLDENHRTSETGLLDSKVLFWNTSVGDKVAEWLVEDITDYDKAPSAKTLGKFGLVLFATFAAILGLGYLAFMVATKYTTYSLFGAGLWAVLIYVTLSLVAKYDGRDNKFAKSKFFFVNWGGKPAVVESEDEPEAVPATDDGQKSNRTAIVIGSVVVLIALLLIVSAVIGGITNAPAPAATEQPEVQIVVPAEAAQLPTVVQNAAPDTSALWELTAGPEILENNTVATATEVTFNGAAWVKDEEKYYLWFSSDPMSVTIDGETYEYNKNGENGAVGLILVTNDTTITFNVAGIWNEGNQNHNVTAVIWKAPAGDADYMDQWKWDNKSIGFLCLDACQLLTR